MPINADYEYFEALKKYEQTIGSENKILALEDVIRKAPKHKGAENLLAELKTRLKKLKEKSEKNRKVGTGKKGIRKEGYQAVLVGFTNVGKSSILSKITNAKPLILETLFTTKEPNLGTMDYSGVKAQIVDLPSADSAFFDFSIVNTADCLLFVVDKFEDIKALEEKFPKARGQKLVIFNKIDLLSEQEKTKLESKLKSKKIHFVLFSALTNVGIEDLKREIFSFMGVIRIYTKEPGKAKSNFPVVLNKGATVKDVAESIRKGLSSTIKETKVTGPSAKFSNQKVGVNHILKDMDIVEFYFR